MTKKDRAPETGIIRTKTRARSRGFALRRWMNPNPMGLIGLAFAIAIWGYGYRLCTYQLHPSSTSPTVAAKLCLEPRHSSLSSAFRLRAGTLSLPVAPAAVSVFLPPSAGCASAFVCAPADHAPRAASFQFLIPFRSPPPRRFSLA
ncbi:MAG TPA: hypothetical protein VGG26_00535 [Terracidiphilus sp.]